MSPALLARLGQIDRRVLRFAFAAVLGLAALEGWQLVLRAPLNDWLALGHARTEAELALDGVRALPDDLPRLRSDVAQLEARLAQGPGSDLAGGVPSARLMGELDRLAHTAHVRLLAVRPGAEGRVQGFASTSQDVEARGHYAELLAWLIQVEQDLGPLVISRLHLIRRNADDPELLLQFSLTAYRGGTQTGEVH